jgi:hypothetical protein
MTTLTRRRDTRDPHREIWAVYFGDVRIGSIARRAGVPAHAPQWGWTCGFYPGTEPGAQQTGTGETFEEARAGFELAWSEIAPTITEAALETWRQNRDWHAWKYRMWEARLPLPTQRQDGRSVCFCGATHHRRHG